MDKLLDRVDEVFPKIVIPLLVVGALSIGYYVGHATGFIPSPACVYGKTTGVPEGSLPPLYPEISWGAETTKEEGFLPMYGKETIIEQGYKTSSQPQNTIPKSFIEYYKKELGLRCWIEIDHFNYPEGYRYAYTTRDDKKHLWLGADRPAFFDGIEYKDKIQAYISKDFK